ncbi:MAG: M1 family metallopeptidase [Planctomycetota bacterium]|nr:M1 family metallopeptidase [Planctomycetota bacterium]
MFRKHHLLALLLAASQLLAACQGAGRGRPEMVRAVRHEAPPRAFDAEHYRLALTVDPLSRSIEGSCSIRMRANEVTARVELDLVGLTVTEVVTQLGVQLSFKQDAEILSVDLLERAAKGALVELEISYRGSPKKGLWFAGEENGAPTHLFTQGECEDSRWWFPCFDYPADRATSELIVTMPAEWRSVAAGELKSSSAAEKSHTEHWQMTTPHPVYLTTLVAGDLALEESDWEGVPLWFLAPKKFAEWMPASFEETDEILDCFSELTGLKYPYSKYSQACVEGFPVGGMENISATTLTCETLSDSRGYQDEESWSLVAHEAAHQWFGDLLTCETWPHIWLNEGFATYFTLLYAEESRGLDDFRVRVRDTQESYLRLDRGFNRRPTVWDQYVDPIDLFFGGQAYPGGASRLHLLRFILGDEDFFAGIRRYVSLHANSGVTTNEFQQVMEEVSGRDLEIFFRQWFYSAGFPEFRVEWSWDEEDSVVRLRVEQTQAKYNWTPEVFKLPVDVEVKTGSDSELHRIQLSKRSEVFELACDVRPRWVRFDKNGWIPKQLESFKSLEEWGALAKEDDDVNGRRDAIKALGLMLKEAESALGSVLSAKLQDSLETDPVAAVRASAATALSGDRQGLARAALERAASTDESARVRIAALTSLVREGPDPELASFAEAVFEEAYSWWTAAAAARVRVAAGADKVEWIEQALERSSPHDVLRASLLALLGEQDDPRVKGILRAWSSDDAASTKARAAAVSALALVSRNDSEIAALLTGFLVDAPYALQSAAVNGLAISKTQLARRALSAHYSSLIDPRQRRVVEISLQGRL